MNWKSVKEYPEDDTYVLVYGPKYPDIAIIYYDGCCYNASCDETIGITHWMQLPEKPKCCEKFLKLHEIKETIVICPK